MSSLDANKGLPCHCLSCTSLIIRSVCPRSTFPWTTLGCTRTKSVGFPGPHARAQPWKGLKQQNIFWRLLPPILQHSLAIKGVTWSKSLFHLRWWEPQIAWIGFSCAKYYRDILPCCFCCRSLVWAGETSILDFYLLFILETTVIYLAGAQKGLILEREREREEKCPHSFIQIRAKGVIIVYPLK